MILKSERKRMFSFTFHNFNSPKTNEFNVYFHFGADEPLELCKWFDSQKSGAMTPAKMDR